MNSELRAVLDLLSMLFLDPHTFVLMGLLVAAAWSDCKSHRIPNVLVFGGTVFALGLNWLFPPMAGIGLLWALKGLLLGLALLLPFYFLRAMGAGDVKLMAMVGAFVGFPSIFYAVLGTFLAGGAMAMRIRSPQGCPASDAEQRAGALPGCGTQHGLWRKAFPYPGLKGLGGQVAVWRGDCRRDHRVSRAEADRRRLVTIDELGDCIVISSTALRLVEEPASAVPMAPHTPDATGLDFAFLVELLAKILFVRGQMRLTDLVDHVKLLPGVLGPVLEFMRAEKLCEVVRRGESDGATIFALTDVGRMRAEDFRRRSQYAGPAPVSLHAYVQQVQSQAVGNMGVTRETLTTCLRRRRSQGDTAGAVRRGNELGSRDLHLRTRGQRQDLHRRTARRAAFRRHRSAPRHRGGRRGDSGVRPAGPRTGGARRR